ncbi:MAG: sigma 54-interacting transcriptional regulator [Desulfitobacteriaceae bacterium]|nr:sigma 54-interacting transcriptional regulator [Desulfitobacteriaceae bacterium]MDD4752207.1 sigma 54-interacting transcriptional regulator [Desulfitobacteriaceae bacterium]
MQTEEDKVYNERVKQLKLEILNGVVDLSEVDLVQPVIIDSWIRSSNYGLKAHLSPRTCPVIPKAEMEKLLVENRFLINATLSSLRQFESVLNANYDIILSDPNGVNLLVMLGQNNNISFKNFNLVPGTVWNEKTIGTSAMSLAPILKRPIQVCGPEIFLDDFHDVAGSSAPIFDIKDNMAGVLSIGTVFYQCVNSFNLSLVASIAELIQKEFQLALYEEMYKATNEASDEAMITVDGQGFIAYVNQLAVSLFQHVGNDLIGRPFDSIFGNQPKIKKTMKSGRSLSNTYIDIPKLGSCQCSVSPIRDRQGSRFGCLISLKRCKADPVTTNGDSFAAIIGSSAPIRKIVSMSRRFAKCESNILLQGESGTGKELFARAIHNISRPNRPFVAVNCGAIPKTLAESELFGYEGGSFTGAERQGRQGKIEYAGNGTLFLDEIGDLPLELQPILLRVLEEKQIVRVGGTRSIQVDFQLVAATNKNLFDLMEKGQFREDLYYRLAIFKIVIPPLRERGQDILLLSDHFLSALAQKRGIPLLTLNRSAKNILTQYSWPGNVRQLKHCLTYAASISSDGVIRSENLPEEIRLTPVSGEEESVHNAEMESIRQALKKSGHNVSDAARSLGLSRATLYRKIKKYGL